MIVYYPWRNYADDASDTPSDESITREPDFSMFITTHVLTKYITWLTHAGIGDIIQPQYHFSVEEIKSDPSTTKDKNRISQKPGVHIIQRTLHTYVILDVR